MRLPGRGGFGRKGWLPAFRDATLFISGGRAEAQGRFAGMAACTRGSLGKIASTARPCSR